MTLKTAQKVKIPRIRAFFLGWFVWFVRKYLRRHFHSVAINRAALGNVNCGAKAGVPSHSQPTRSAGTLPPLEAAGAEQVDRSPRLTMAPQDSVIVYANHAAWWDPLTAIFLSSTVLADYRMFAPIDAEALKKYPIFGSLGFFPVAQSSLEGAADFLRISRAILREPGTSVWVTPEGRFVDARDTEAELMPGLAHLAVKMVKRSRVSAMGQAGDAKLNRVWILAGAVEYTFWEERQAELLVWFSEPICSDWHVASQEMEDPLDKREWQQRLTSSLRTAQGKLAQASTARDSSQFEILLGSQAGTFFVYDWWRKGRAWLRGQPLDLEHSDKLQKD
ncbi:lysophospholipid acyltransferase family protein [Aureliella helgolandensis]|uniref:Acyltransferase n=1 Tax=Aureliella helgolandensis TaxID=2527968 RepID=A0A518G5Q9_9BACT|nr:lysophospholipid acyltransferase family protein [Aureliella helgolandensis]QDV23915.1 Acyltransferase [Aureliella helgolandensis]